MIFKDKYHSEYNSIESIFNGDNSQDTILKELEKVLKTEFIDQEMNDEISTPFSLLEKIYKKIYSIQLKRKPAILDYSCGKGNIIVYTFLRMYKYLIKKEQDPVKTCKIIIENCLYFGDINEKNVAIVCFILHNYAKYLTKQEVSYKFNYYVGDSFKLDITKHWNVDKMDMVFVNPPFHDDVKRKKTQHKLWIDFTKLTFNKWLKENGTLIQISPTSFSTPSSKILTIFKEKCVSHLFLKEEEFFPDVNTTISWYIVQNTNDTSTLTNINDKYKLLIDDSMLYLPSDFCDESISIHKKVIFDTTEKQQVKYDYTTAHNVLIHKEHPTISKTETEQHKYPMFHTNKQVWYSSVDQDFRVKKKVMWTRSGYTKPFFDDGTLGVTDMGYYILVKSKREGENLDHNLNSTLFKYILKTAKWSGFGNEKVFAGLPKLPNKKMTDSEMYKYFNLTEQEYEYIKSKV